MKLKLTIFQPLVCVACHMKHSSQSMHIAHTHNFSFLSQHNPGENYYFAWHKKSPLKRDRDKYLHCSDRMAIENSKFPFEFHLKERKRKNYSTVQRKMSILFQPARKQIKHPKYLIYKSTRFCVCLPFHYISQAITWISKVENARNYTIGPATFLLFLYNFQALVLD